MNDRNVKGARAFPLRRMEIVVDHFPRPLRHAMAGAFSVITVGLDIYAPGTTWIGLVALYLALANRDEIRLDSHSRRYRRWRGVWPFVLPSEGDFSELKSIKLERVTSEADSNVHGYHITIEWPNLRYQPWTMARKDSLKAGEEYARSLGEALDLPVEEGEQLTRLRKALRSMG
jgi:hypothetical protein